MKAIKAWALVGAADNVIHQSVGMVGPLLFSRRADAVEWRNPDQRIVRVEIRELPRKVTK